VNRLYFGDCLDVLRNEIADDSVDLIYLDPPFNSSRSYNLLFRAPTGHESQAQISAFEDTWHWGEQAEREFQELLRQPNTGVSELVTSLRRSLGENDMMAYLTMMSSRLLELSRVMRPDASLYLHCDQTASHYLKIVLDAVFDPIRFLAEITWKRTHSHGNVSRNFGAVCDSILFYAKSDIYKWNQQYTSMTADYIEKTFKYKDPDGRRWQSVTLRNPGQRPNLHFPYTASNGITYQPHPNGWSCNLERLQKYDLEGRLHYPASPDGSLRLKMYLDESSGTRLQNLWEDIPPIGAQADERLGYPTQKPLPLLERIISTSSNPGDVILDPFCGCGTAVHAAQKLGREWIGIDITHLAVSLIEKRLRNAFPGIEFEVHGTPKDLEGARELASRDKYQFQWWACSLVGAQPWQDKKKGADRGIDGIIYFQDEKGIPKKIIVSVKGGETVGRAMIADLKNSVEREKAQIGLFVTLAVPTREMVKEALTAGFYESPNFKSGDYPKIQILTIEGLLNGTQRPRYPDLSQGAYTFKRATQELEAAQGTSDLFSPD
jgi:site-specific DNA-methyltransferase (adenine-specific)